MPNWCENSGYVRLPANASAEAQETFKKLAEGDSKGWFSNVLPCPPEMYLGIENTQATKEYLTLEWLQNNSKFQGDFGTLVDTDTGLPHLEPTPEYLSYLQNTFGATNWYQWCGVHYGTKWDVNATLDVIENEIMFTFDSAWSPPVNFFLHLAETYGLEFELQYVEHGMGFCGTASYTDGEFVQAALA